MRRAVPWVMVAVLVLGTAVAATLSASDSGNPAVNELESLLVPARDLPPGWQAIGGPQVLFESAVPKGYACEVPPAALFGETVVGQRYRRVGSAEILSIVVGLAPFRSLEGLGKAEARLERRPPRCHLPRRTSSGTIPYVSPIPRLFGWTGYAPPRRVDAPQLDVPGAAGRGAWILDGRIYAYYAYFKKGVYAVVSDFGAKTVGDVAPPVSLVMQRL